MEGLAMGDPQEKYLAGPESDAPGVPAKDNSMGGQAPSYQADKAVGDDINVDRELLTDEEADSNSVWSSRIIFLAAAISSAVGMGNIWRFPYLTYRHGGGAFFIPYLLSLIIISIPVLILEMSLGQRSQGAHPKSFSSIMNRGRGTGFGVGTLAFVLVFYYGLLVMWSMMYFLNSWGKKLPWAYEFEQLEKCPTATTYETCEQLVSCTWSDLNMICEKDVIKKARSFFFRNCNSVADAHGAMEHGKILLSIPMVVLSAVLWLCIFLSIRWGTRVMGYILYVTMVMPTVLIVVLLIVGFTRTGMNKGLKVYLGTWDFTKLREGSTIWTNAAGQVIFSTSCACGTMSAYAAANKKKQPVFQDAVIIGFGDTLYAVLCGFIVFSFAGSLAHAAGVEVKDLQLSGPTLAYMTYPTGVGQLSYPAAQIICVLFFATVFLLAYTTAISDTIAAASLFEHSKWRRNMSKETFCGVLCVVLFILEVIFLCVSVGQQVLDAVDNFLNNICLISLVALECIVAGYGIYHHLQVRQIGKKAALTLPISLFVSVIIATIVGFSTKAPVRYAVPCVIAGLGLCGIIAAAVFAIKDQQHPEMPAKTKLWWLFLGNLEVYREEMNLNITGIWRTPFVWTLCVKFIVPVVAFILMLSFVCDGDNTIRYSGFPASILVIGMVWNLIIVAVVVLGSLYPSALDWFLQKDLQEYENEIEHASYRGEKFYTIEDVRRAHKEE